MVNPKIIMTKRLIITEEEKNDIKSLYNISEQTDGYSQFLTGLMDVALSSNVNGSSGGASTQGVSAKGQALLDNPIFKKKLTEISAAIGIDEDSIIKLMNHESFLDSSSKNSIGCVGLIQFCPTRPGGTTKIINGKTYNLEDIRNNLETQMDVIKEFWVSAKATYPINSPIDLYIYNFVPIAVGKNNDFVLEWSGRSAETVAKSNPVFNTTLGRPIETPLTVGDLERYYRKKGMI